MVTTLCESPLKLCQSLRKVVLVDPPHFFMIIYLFFGFLFYFYFVIFYFFKKFIYLYIYIFNFFGCVGSSFLCEGFLQLRQAGATLHRGAWASHYGGLSCCGAQAPDAQAQQLWLTGLVALRHVGSSQTRARTRVLCTGRQILNHCVTREAPPILFIYFLYYYYYFWLCQVLVEARRIFFIVVLGLFHCGAQASLQLYRAGSRARGLCSLQHAVSLVEVHELSSCGIWAQVPCDMWDLSSPTRDQIRVPCIGRKILYHWTTGEVPGFLFQIHPFHGAELLYLYFLLNSLLMAGFQSLQSIVFTRLPLDRLDGSDYTNKLGTKGSSMSRTWPGSLSAIPPPPAAHVTAYYLCMCRLHGPWGRVVKAGCYKTGS